MMNELPQASRNTDPITSHLAEAEMTGSGARQKQADFCLQWVATHQGSTYRELAELSRVADRNIFSRRLNDLKVKGMVFTGEIRKCRVSKRKMQTWYTSPQQGELL